VSRLHASLIAALLLGGCAKDPGDANKNDAKQNEPDDAAPELGPDGKPLGRIVASQYIDLRTLANKPIAEVEAVLGEPTSTGTDRVSCVRFVPERVFFACEQEIRVYPHREFEFIRIEFEDGRAAMVALSGLPGDGPFDPKAALVAVGLELPGEPKHDNPPLNAPQAGGEPGAVVDRWEWGNSRARLLIDGLEHRVRLTTVNGEWRRAKLELINNHPLTADQKQRIKPVPAAEPSTP
jgi:hypothetical protein